MLRQPKFLLGTLVAIVLISVLACPLAALADTGPKPSITIHCVNMPDSEVYIDLLIDAPITDGDFRFGNMSSGYDPYEHYHKNRLEILMNYNTDGWRPALVTGTSNPLWGELCREVLPDGIAEASFNYFGVPDRFKVIIVTEDGVVTVSNIVERKAFNSVIDVDFSTRISVGDYNEIAIAERNPYIQTAKQTAFTLSVTYIIEGLVLLLFGFSLKQNWKPFVFVNLGTQIILSLLMLFTFNKSGTASAFIAFFLFEIAILITETVLYIFLLRGQTKLRSALYAVTANIASFFAGLLLMGYFIY